MSVNVGITKLYTKFLKTENYRYSDIGIVVFLYINGFWAGGIIGPYFFENEAGQIAIVNSSLSTEIG